ncbi:Hsp20/alpha crystallin family protein [Psychroflexus sp. CAK57W]|uniref:Hsp20/alpha crystallin family protein n=1 Tax=Psychroflexus curvus TaxID=2873595 RepID=UPI001CCDAFF4|nr:Hsp20/alpha crystallin family protein [Psychroflexus curvus]MBZ9627526.1 Hsp20/alpha crystallin family protein [Psychroflexus curvus]MBZ9786012.1 Hsp20/alpha crystallin family protein [Psychroflexus curvus]
MIPTRYANQDVGLLDRLFNNDMFHRDFSETNTTSPSVNIKENEDRFGVEMAVPGFEKDDFNIELNHNKLTISSEKKEEKSHIEVERYTRKEFSYQSFRRTFTLPNTVDGEKISAEYKNGVLCVEIPKLEEAKPKPARQIEIR